MNRRNVDADVGVPTVVLLLGLAGVCCVSVAAQERRTVIRPGQEGRFTASVGHPRTTTARSIGWLGGREVVEIDTIGRTSNMGKMLADDDRGGIWYLETRDDKAVRVDRRTLEMTEYSLPAGGAPYSLAIDSRGVLWMTAHGIEMLLEFDPATREVLSHQPPTHGFLIHINVDRRDDTVYFSQPGANLIVAYHRQRGFREYAIPTPQAGPARIDFDAAGNVWFPELYANKLARLNPRTGHTEEWPLLTPGALPSYCRVDASGTVWVSLPMADKIAAFKDGKFKEFSIPTHDSVVSTTVIDDEGNIWFTEGGWRGSAGGNKIGRLDPRTGKVDELKLPAENAQPLGMIRDSEGVIWFQQSNAGRIAQIKVARTSTQDNR